METSHPARGTTPETDWRLVASVFAQLILPVAFVLNKARQTHDNYSARPLQTFRDINVKGAAALFRVRVVWLAGWSSAASGWWSREGPKLEGCFSLDTHFLPTDESKHQWVTRQQDGPSAGLTPLKTLQSATVHFWNWDWDHQMGNFVQALCVMLMLQRRSVATTLPTAWQECV